MCRVVGEGAQTVKLNRRAGEGEWLGVRGGCPGHKSRR